MKRFFSILLSCLLACLIILLLLGLFFLMPLEFLVSSWQLFNASASTEGVVVDSQVVRGRKSGTSSRITYRYSVDGVEYVSGKIQAGWISDQAYQEGGDSLAKTYQTGSHVTVRYDPDTPSFSLVCWGWPKWSYGFSAGVWGITFSHWVKTSTRKRKQKERMLAFTRAFQFSGFFTIFFFPITLGFAEMKVIGIIYYVSSLALVAYHEVRAASSRIAGKP